VGRTLKGRGHYHVHAHDFPELFLVDRGTGIHRFTDATRRLDEGDVVTVRADQPHGFRACTPEGFRYLNVAFPQATLDRFRAAYLASGEPFWSGGSQPYCQRLTPAKTRALQTLIDQLAQAPRDQFHIDRFLLNLIHELRQPQVGGLRLSALPDWLRSACEQALDPAAPVPSVNSFIRAACRSHEHVCRVMERCAGRTPTGFVNEVRLARAAHRLTMTDQGISRIALDCGFGNLGHFYRRFRDRYGTTPRRYRLLASL